MTFLIEKGYQDRQRAEKEKAYRYLASLGITMPKSDHPEDLFLIGIPIDADTYDEYAAAIVARTIKLFGRMLALKEPREIHERNLLAILAVNAIAFSFNHKLPIETETALSEYLAELWGRSEFAALLKKIDNLPPEFRGDLVVLSEIGSFDREEFRQWEHEPAGESPDEGASLEDIINASTDAMNTAKRLYKFLYAKADWQEEKIERETHYDHENVDDKGHTTSLRDVLLGREASDTYDAIDEKIETAALHMFIEKLPSGMKSAVKKFLADEDMTPTEQKAKNRGIKKLEAWMASYRY